MSRHVTQHMTESLQGHQLEELTPPSSPVRSFYLRPPGGGQRMSTLITFTPEGMSIQGDIQPGEDGVIAPKGFDLAWFEGDLLAESLCEAFLSKAFYMDAAVLDLRSGRWAENAGLQKVADRAEYGLLDEESLRRELFEAGLTYTEVELVGYDYPPVSTGWLCAIHRRFRELRGAG